MNRDNANMETNRQCWDQRVPVHFRSKMYRDFLATLEAGGHCLDPIIVQEVGDVSGKSLLHLQCHIGHDTLSWARLGARVTGLDFSEPAVQAAQRVARVLKMDARFVCANVYEAPKAVDEKFDVVFASVGVFCWIPDLPQWMKAAVSMLRKGGVLYLMDGHPFAEVLEERPDFPDSLGIVNDYFDPGPHHYGPGPSYASDAPDQETGESVEWRHTIGDFVTAVAGAGLRIEFLHEHPRDFYQRFKVMEPAESGRWRLPGNLRDKVPLTMSLRAVAV